MLGAGLPRVLCQAPAVIRTAMVEAMPETQVRADKTQINASQFQLVVPNDNMRRAGQVHDGQDPYEALRHAG